MKAPSQFLGLASLLPRRQISYMKCVLGLRLGFELSKLRIIAPIIHIYRAIRRQLPLIFGWHHMHNNL